jgi:branched-chain amino acid transport system permease protein
VTTIWAGLSVGAVYVLVAVGYNMVFIASSTFNFAQSQFVMLGTFIAVVAHAEYGWPLGITMIAGAVLGFVVGVVEERVAIRPIAGRGAHGELVTTVGAAVIIEGIALEIWGADPRRVEPFVSQRPVEIFGGRVSIDDLVIIGVAISVVVAIDLWSRMTRVGLMSSATSEDREAAMIRGINVKRLSTLTVGVAAALGVLLGPIIGTKTFAATSLGNSLVLKAFVVLAIGGFGSYPGVLVGGFVLGLVEAYTSFRLGGKYVNLVVFGLLLVVLFTKPSGLFGKRAERVV